MSDDLNLPASLERLEINPERHECKVDENLPATLNEPECSLESLSLKAACPKGSCGCNKKKDNRDKDKGVKRLVPKRPILRRSKLSPAVLRAPILKLPPIEQSTTPLNSSIGDVGPSVIGESFETDQNRPRCIVPEYGIGEYACNSCPVPLDALNRLQSTSSSNSSSSSSTQSCCVQARRAETNQSTVTDDTNIEELASYFDLFVHIPKKMSLMAEMMYI